MEVPFSMSVIVKICGLANPEALEAALGAGADMVGFVFFSKSPRHVGLATAADLGARVEKRALKVLLTVDADDVTLAAAIAALDPQIIQAHGRETPARIASIRGRFGLPVMKAVAIGEAADIAQAALFEKVADALLLDAKPPSGAARPGGHGRSFDWTLLRGIEAKKPWLLAGGLHRGSVGAALAATKAPGVDVSSGVESSVGVKDPEQIRAFIAAVRAAEQDERWIAPEPGLEASGFSSLGIFGAAGLRRSANLPPQRK